MKYFSLIIFEKFLKLKLYLIDLFYLKLKMENLLFIRIEILVFLISLLYIFYYIWSKIYSLYFSVKKIVKPEKIKKRKTALNKVNLKSKNLDNKLSKNNDNHLNEKKKQRIYEIIKKVKLNSSKWYFDTSKNLIVEWLSIDKNNKQLNMQLAFIYEKEKNYWNAEYIYKDLLENYNGDYEIMKKLWYLLIIQEKYIESLLIYESLHNKKKSDNEVIEILSDLNFSLEKYKKSLKYTNLYLSSNPRDVNKLYMKAVCLDNLNKIDESIEVYKRIIELQPYNTKAKESLISIQEKKASVF